MRSIIQLVRAMPPSLAQHHRIRQACAPAHHVDRGAAGEIQDAHGISPAALPMGVPRPARDGIINKSGPDEHEHCAGQEAAPLGRGAGGQDHGDGAEQALVESKKQIGDLVRILDKGLVENTNKKSVG